MAVRTAPKSRQAAQVLRSAKNTKRRAPWRELTRTTNSTRVKLPCPYGEHDAGQVTPARCGVLLALEVKTGPHCWL